jgi:hypothetical protein
LSFPVEIMIDLVGLATLNSLCLLVTLVLNFHCMFLEKVNRRVVVSLPFRASDVDVKGRPSFPPTFVAVRGGL